MRRPVRRQPRRAGADDSRYRAIADGLPIVAYAAAFDVQGAFTYMSPRVEELTGYSAREWTSGKGLWLKVMHPDDRARLLPTLTRAHRDGRNFSAEYRLIDKAGKIRWIKDESRARRGEDGRPLGIRGTWTDITERKEREKSAAGLSRELEFSRAELVQLVSAASHELRAPLRRIVNLGELLSGRAVLDGDSAALLAEMRASAAAAQALVAGLVTYAEAERRAPSEAVDLERSLRRVLQDLAEPIAASGAQIVSGPLPKVWAEPARVELVLRALLDNALKFRRAAPPRVRVSAAREGPDWIVSVADEGVGLKAQQARRAFELFARHDADGLNAGLGLGLAVSRKIVESLGGRIWVESEPGEGATFRFSLRCASARDDA